MRRGPSSRQEAARGRWDELSAEREQLRAAAWSAAIAAAASGGATDIVQRLYDGFVLDLAVWERPLSSAVWRWAGGHSPWLPLSWPSCASARLHRLQGELDLICEANNPTIKETIS